MVERHTGDIGVDLHAERAVFKRARDFTHAAIGRGHRRLRHPAGELVGILRANLGKAVVHQLGVFLDLRALGQSLQRRHRIGQDLRIVLEAADDLAANLEVVDAGNLAHALADARRGFVSRKAARPCLG